MDNPNNQVIKCVRGVITPPCGVPQQFFTFRLVPVFGVIRKVFLLSIRLTNSGPRMGEGP